MLNIRDNIAELRGILIRLIDDKLKQPHPAVAAADRERAERLLDEIQMAWECGRVEHHHHYEPAPMADAFGVGRGLLRAGPGREIA